MASRYLLLCFLTGSIKKLDRKKERRKRMTAFDRENVPGRTARRRSGAARQWEWVLFAAAALALFYRLPFGVDITDEAFYAAEPYLIARGAVPLVDNWSQTPLTFLLTAPLVWLFVRLTGGTEGLAYALLAAAFLFRLAVPLLVRPVLRRKLGANWAAAGCILLLLSGGRTLDYNSISRGLLVLSGALLWDGLDREAPRAAAARYAAAGLVMALCALAHGAQIVNCLLFLLLLPLLDRRRPTYSLFYAGAGLAAAAAVVLWLELTGGGGVFSGLRWILTKHNYFRIPHPPLSEELRGFAVACLSFGLHALPPFAAVLACAVFSARRTRDRGLALWGAAAALAAGCGGYLLHYLRSLSRLSAFQYPFLLLFLTFPVWLLLLPAERRRRFLPALALFWAPELVSLLTASFSWISLLYRLSLLSFGAFLSLPAAAEALAGCPAPRFLRRTRRLLPPLLTVLLAAAVLAPQFLSVCQGDEPLPALSCRVERGVFRGLRTTPERAEALQAMEEDIRARTSPGESVLFADLFPAGYLMTEAAPCTPSTWDPCHFRNGFQDADIYLEWFEKTGRLPDKIFFVSIDEHPLSIDDPDNAFAAFVREHYGPAGETEGEYPLRMFTRRE